MRRYMIALVSIGFLALSAPAHAQARPVSQSPNTIQELFQFLYQCAKVPPGTEGSELTLRFSLTHYGALRGKPMITYSNDSAVADRDVFVLGQVPAQAIARVICSLNLSKVHYIQPLKKNLIPQPPMNVLT
jgi:hypothetical protein